MQSRDIASTFFGTVLAGGFTAVVGATAVTEKSKHFDMLLYGGAAAIVLSLLGLIVLFFLGFRRAETMSGDDFSINTGDISGSGNRIGHEFYKPIPRKLDQGFANQLLQTLPKDRPTAVEYDASDPECGQFGVQIHNFLQQSGYSMKNMAAVMMPLPDPGVSYEDKNGVMTVWVGRNA